MTCCSWGRRCPTVKQGSGKPTAVIPAQDYGMGNAANVLALAQSLLG